MSEEEIVDGVRYLTYTHRIQVGVTPIREYGLALAKTVKFPMKVVPRAEALMRKITELKLSDSAGVVQASSVKAETSLTSTDNERKFYELYANLASLVRRRENEKETEEIKTGIAGLLIEFGSKCSQSMLTTFKNQNLKSVFNNSVLFSETESFIKSSEARINRVEINSSQATVPETQETAISTDTAQTAMTNTSWMTGHQSNEITRISKLSYHSLLKRIAERRDKDISKESCFRSTSFNEDKGFKRLPFVKPLVPEQINNSLFEFQDNINNQSFEFQGKSKNQSYKIEDNFNKTKEAISSIDDPFKESQQIENNTSPRINSPDIFGDEIDECPQMKSDQVLGCGDYNWKTPTKQAADTSFFNQTQKDITQVWENELEEEDIEKDFKFDSPEDFNEIPLFAGTQNMEIENEPNVLETSKKMSFFDTTVEDPIELSGLFNTQPKPVSIVDLNSSTSLKASSSFHKTNRQMSPLNASVRSRDSQYNFRLKLLDLSNRGYLNKTQEVVNKTQNSRRISSFPQMPRNQNLNKLETFDYTYNLLDIKKERKPDPVSIPFSLKPEFDDLDQEVWERSSRMQEAGFLNKSNSIRRDDYLILNSTNQDSNRLEQFRNRQSQANAIRSKQEDYYEGGTMINAENQSFKQPWTRSSMTVNSASETVSSIPYLNESKQETDNSDWLAQYCQNRVKNLGVPKRSLPRSKKKSKQDIDCVNSRWNSFYQAARSYNNLGDVSSIASKMSRKRVSFSGSDSS